MIRTCKGWARDKLPYNVQMNFSDELIRAVNFISGPLRAGYIERAIVNGALRPCRVQIIVVHS